MSTFEQKAPILLYAIDIVDGHLTKEEGEFGRWVLTTTNSEKIYKIRINGTIVDKYHSASDGTKKAFTTLSLDDGTATVRIKAWEETAEFLNSFILGNDVDLIGKPRSSEDEVYILPESVVLIEDSNKELYLRAKKIKRYTKKNLIISKEVQPAPEHNQEQKEKIWVMISDSEEGVELEEIITKTKLDKTTVESIIHDLLNDGDIYEPSALKFKKI
ncbi:MAG: hypothetical protein KAS52_02015 [Candidatus Heimdallarchaeota archaeon]|nr:hypothetical protein [Candidatus Heimdallarchaeota archaeon]